MEWVETTGNSIDEAKNSALDQLGVDEGDAEFEIVADVKTGLFGRVKSEARVRARVRPTQPRPKDQGNQRRRRSRNEKSDRGADRSGSRRSAQDNAPEQEKPSAESTRGSEVSEDDAHSKPRRSRRGGGNRSKTNRSESATEEGVPSVDEVVALDRQGEVAEEFLRGLFDESQVTAAVSVDVDEEEELVRVSVNGDNLGSFIGPRGVALQSLQELVRTVVQRKTGARNGRILVDVAQYREKRRVALERFTKQIADEVKTAGVQKVLEPMSPADRKIVHDTINDIPGVETSSEGEEPRRYVVIKPAG
jgi:spoIIIJ-associated protein